MYADDHQLFDIDKSISRIESNLQATALKPTNWYDRNLLKDNFKKYGPCYVPGRNKRKDDCEIQIEIHRSKIESYDDIKLLGINIDKSLGFSNHISIICKKASQRLELLES